MLVAVRYALRPGVWSILGHRPVVQSGFVLGVEILVDTFVVRTITVPPSALCRPPSFVNEHVHQQDSHCSG